MRIPMRMPCTCLAHALAHCMDMAWTWHARGMRVACTSADLGGIPFSALRVLGDQLHLDTESTVGQLPHPRLGSRLAKQSGERRWRYPPSTIQGLPLTRAHRMRQVEARERAQQMDVPRARRPAELGHEALAGRQRAALKRDAASQWRTGGTALPARSDGRDRSNSVLMSGGGKIARREATLEVGRGFDSRWTYCMITTPARRRHKWYCMPMALTSCAGSSCADSSCAGSTAIGPRG